MALDVLTSVLKREKSAGWKRGVPVICLDDFHLNLGKDSNNNFDPFWQKFLDWSLHIADSKLAHVVIVPSMAYATENLDGCTSWESGVLAQQWFWTGGLALR